MLIDKGFTAAIAAIVLNDDPDDPEALKILSRPKYRISVDGVDHYFNIEEEMLTAFTHLKKQEATTFVNRVKKNKKERIAR